MSSGFQRPFRPQLLGELLVRFLSCLHWLWLLQYIGLLRTGARAYLSEIRAPARRVIDGFPR